MKTDSRMITKLFFQLLPVQILLVAIGSINAVIDGMIASNCIGPHAMAVTGLYMPVIKVIETVNAVLLGGSQILCGQFLGKNQIERTRNVFSLDMFLISVSSLILTAVSLLFSWQMAVFLRADPWTAGELVQYIRGISIGLLPQMIGAQLSAFLQLEQQQKRSYAGIAAMMSVNIVLDLVFVQVLGWGMLGLGLATAISNWVFFLVLGSYYFTSRAIIKFKLSSIRWTDLGPIVKIGIPGALVTFCLALRGIAINAVLIRYSGNDGLAALAALNTFGYLLYAVTAGLASATRLLVSVYIGEEDRTSLILVMKTALLKGVPLVCGAAAAVFLLARPLTSLFFQDPASRVYYLTEWIFRIYPFSMPLSAICVIFINYYQSSSRMKIVNLLSVMDGVLGISLSCFILAPLSGALGVWAAHVLNGVYTTIAIVLYACIVTGHFPVKIEDLLTLPEDFGVSEDRRLDLTIRNETEVTDTSGLVMDFCRKQGIDARRSYYAGLCLEEMAANIVEHGFSDGRKHSVDVRVVYKEEELLLRIKDDCRAFDPKEKLALIDPDDITHNIGLRIVSRLSKSMFYSNMLGLNVLTITL